MKKLMVVAMIGAVILLMVSGVTVTPVIAAEKITLSWSDYAPPMDDRYSYYKQFIKRVEEETNGKVEINLYPSEQLSKAVQQFEAMMRGTIDICAFVPVYYAGKIPLAVLSSEASYTEPGDPAVLTSRMIKENSALFARYGIKFLGWSGELAPMCLVGQKIFRTFDDVKDVKIRAPGSAAKAVNLWGGTGVSIPNSEIYMALQRGVVDASYQTIATVKSQRLWEVVPAVTFHRVGGSPTLVCMNMKKWNSLPDDVKKAFEKVGREMPLWSYKHARDFVSKTEDFLKTKFKEAYKLTEEESKPFDEVSMGWAWKPITKKLGKPAQDWWNKILAVEAETKKARAEGKPIRFFE